MKLTPVRLRAPLMVAGIVGVVALAAAPASAHVTVSSTDAAQGGFGTLSFKVPTESETASTTSLTVTLPLDSPFAFVSAQAKPGWSVKTTTVKLDEPVTVGDFTLDEAVSTVTWTSKKGIAPGQFDTFALSAGPLPEIEQITFEAEQTYSDGEVVSWSDIATGDEEAERPAPTLALAASTGDSHGTAGTAAVDATADDSPDTVARALGGAGLLAGLGALVVAVRENRRRARS